MERIETNIITKKHIGIAGGIASGKSTICEIISRLNYSIISLSDFIKNEAYVKGIKISDRIDYFTIANLMREEKGNDILAKMAIEKIKRENIERFIIDGIRTTEEVILFRNKFYDFFLIGVEVSLATRLIRIKKRQREIDSNNNYNILNYIEKENSDTDNGCQLIKVMDMCDNIIDGNIPIQKISNNCFKLISS
ncbi:MAG: dephospho-CoA kinase [bacterium]|nr:dephospho-CoA kinase [bacterium]